MPNATICPLPVCNENLDHNYIVRIDDTVYEVDGVRPVPGWEGHVAHMSTDMGRFVVADHIENVGDSVRETWNAQIVKQIQMGLIDELGFKPEVAFKVSNR